LSAERTRQRDVCRCRCQKVWRSPRVFFPFLSRGVRVQRSNNSVEGRAGKGEKGRGLEGRTHAPLVRGTKKAFLSLREKRHFTRSSSSRSPLSESREKRGLLARGPKPRGKPLESHCSFAHSCVWRRGQCRSAESDFLRIIRHISSSSFCCILRAFLRWRLRRRRSCCSRRSRCVLMREKGSLETDLWAAGVFPLLKEHYDYTRTTISYSKDDFSLSHSLNPRRSLIRI